MMSYERAVERFTTEIAYASPLQSSARSTYMHIQRDEVALGALQERLELLLRVDGFGRRLALYRAHFWLG